MISDLSEYHGLDLVTVLAEHNRSPRTMLALLAKLPDDSALAAAVRGEPRGWGYDRHLATLLFDAVQQNSWLTVLAAGPKRRPARPKPMWRPKGEKRSARVVTVAQLVKGG